MSQPQAAQILQGQYRRQLALLQRRYVQLVEMNRAHPDEGEVQYGLSNADAYFLELGEAKPL